MAECPHTGVIEVALSKQIPDLCLCHEVFLWDNILGYKFLLNVIIMRKGNIQCFTVSPLNDKVI